MDNEINEASVKIITDDMESFIDDFDLFKHVLLQECYDLAESDEIKLFGIYCSSRRETL